MIEKPEAGAATILATWDLVHRLADPDLHATYSERAGGWDLDNPERPDAHRKHDYLTALRVARSIQAALESFLVTTAVSAQRCGADFADIGAAQGMSRQAARQAIKRATTRHRATLAGGPRDGQQILRFHAETTVRYGVPGSRDELDPWLDEDEGTAVYRRKHGSPEIFEFQHLEDRAGKVLPAEPDRRPRVHQLALAWGMDSRIVLKQVRTIDPQVRTASSRVDLATVEQLKGLILRPPPVGN